MNITNVSFYGLKKSNLNAQVTEDVKSHKRTERAETDNKTHTALPHKTNPIKGYILGLTLAAGLTAAAPTETYAQNKKQNQTEIVTHHKVKKGETLYSIAKQHGLTVPELKKLNNIPENKNQINAGTALKVSKDNTKTQSTKTVQIPSQIQKANPKDIDGNDGIFSLTDIAGEEGDFVYVFDEGNALHSLNDYEGQKWTPALADKVVNKVLNVYSDKNNQYDFIVGDGGGEFHMSSMAKFGPYLKPETRNRLFNAIKEYPRSVMGYDYKPEEMKKFYNSLNAKQKNEFTSLILSELYAISYTITNDVMGDGKNIADLIFENKLTPQTFSKVKKLLIELDKPNGISRTKTESKAMIERLEQTGKITKAQGNELRKSIKLQ